METLLFICVNWIGAGAVFVLWDMLRPGSFLKLWDAVERSPLGLLIMLIAGAVVWPLVLYDIAKDV